MLLRNFAIWFKTEVVVRALFKVPVSSVNRVKSIVLPLASASSSEILTVYESQGPSVGAEFQPGYKVIGFNAFIKNLKAFASLKSLPTAPLPNFQLTDSQTQKLIKTLDVEWQSPRKQLNLHVGVQGQMWSQVGSISLLNPYGYPYRVYNLMDLYTDNLAVEVGDNGRLGVSVEDVGFGLLTDQDKVTIHGSYTEEIFLEFAEPPTYITVVGGSSSAGSSPSTLGNNDSLDALSEIGN